MSNYSLNTPYITIAGVVIVVIVAGFTVLAPMFNTIQDTNARLATLEGSVSQKEEFLRNLDRKREELQIQRVHEERLNVMFPTDESFDDIIRVINLTIGGSGATIHKINDNSAAAQNSLNVRRSRGETSSIPESVTPLAVDVELTGTYQQLRLALENLEKAPRLSDVTSLSIKRQGAQGSDQLLTNLLIQFYRQGDSNLTEN